MAKTTIGWREWLAIPSLEVPAIKAKVDTGARTSSLHAFRLKLFEENGLTYARFEVHPRQRSRVPSIPVVAEVVERRRVRSSNGKSELRPVILATIELAGQRWVTELTLARRDEMGFRMLLGRQAVRQRFLVDAGKSFLAGRPESIP